MPTPASFDTTEMIRAMVEQIDAFTKGLEALALRVSALEGGTRAPATPSDWNEYAKTADAKTKEPKLKKPTA